MTYDESSTLMNDMTFRGPVKVALLKYATSIIAEASDITAHNSRYKWAQMAFQNPDITAAQLQPPTVMDPAVQSAGSAIDDNTLQGAVEAVINKVI